MRHPLVALVKLQFHSVCIKRRIVSCCRLPFKLSTLRRRVTSAVLKPEWSLSFDCSLTTQSKLVLSKVEEKKRRKEREKNDDRFTSDYFSISSVPTKGKVEDNQVVVPVGRPTGIARCYERWSRSIVSFSFFFPFLQNNVQFGSHVAD